MIIARVELWPGGDPRALRQIAIVGIANVGIEADGRHRYEARSEGRVAVLTHRQRDGVLMLLARAILALAKETEADPLATVDPDLDRDAALAAGAGPANSSAGTAPSRCRDAR